MIKGWKNNPAWRAHYEKRQAARVEMRAAMCVKLARIEARRRVREALDERPADDAGKIVVVEGSPTVLDRILSLIASFSRRVGL